MSAADKYIVLARLIAIYLDDLAVNDGLCRNGDRVEFDLRVYLVTYLVVPVQYHVYHRSVDDFRDFLDEHSPIADVGVSSVQLLKNPLVYGPIALDHVLQEQFVVVN